jgi:hypothetical protein
MLPEVVPVNPVCVPSVTVFELPSFTCPEPLIVLP